VRSDLPELICSRGFSTQFAQRDYLSKITHPPSNFTAKHSARALINRLLAFHFMCWSVEISGSGIKIKRARLVSQARELGPILIVTVRIIGLFE
jgi:hypothetical protein